MTENRNVALLNVHPIAMNIPQSDYSFEFGNRSEERCDAELTFFFYCDYKNGERWSTESPVRIQCTDSVYPFDYKDMRIQTYQPSMDYQSITIRLNNIPAGFDGMCMVYIDNVTPAPAHGIIKTEYNVIINEIPKGYEQKKDRLFPDISYVGETRYLLRLGECYVYNSGLNIGEFYQLRDELKANVRKDRQWLQSGE